MGHFSHIDPLDSFSCRPGNGISRRVTLQENELGRVEDAYASPNLPPPSGYEPSHQIVVPYHGLFAYCVGSKRWLMDSNGLLLISPGWDFRDEHPVPDVGHAALLVTPPAELLQEICSEGDGVESAFKAPTRSTTMALGLLANVIRTSAASASQLQRDELVLRLLREALTSSVTQQGRESRVVRRAKELLHHCSGERLSLTDIANEVGVSPVYLTQEFTRAEGIPLYRYQLRLRLNQALAELARCDSITGLALDLGFCSHSHFTSAFRSSFGLTPSEYRAAGARRLIPARGLNS